MNISYERNVLKQCFKNREAMLLSVEKVKSPDAFKGELTNFIWSLFLMIHQEGEEPTFSKIKDVLKMMESEEMFTDIETILSREYEDETDWKYHLSFIIEEYTKERIIEVANEMKSGINESSRDLIKTTITELTNLIPTDVESKSVLNALNTTQDNIQKIQDGEIEPYLKTGWTKFDEMVSLSKSRYLLIAAQKKIGKTRYLVDMAHRIMMNNDNIAIQWYTLEMTGEEIIRSYISKITKIPEKKLLGKVDQRLNEVDFSKMSDAYDEISSFPIEFIDDPVDMHTINSKFTHFCKINSNKHCILFIDNIGLISATGDNQVVIEDTIAKSIKDLRDGTKGTIVALHHLSKQSESFHRKAELYKPTVNDIRGSSRLADYANQVILLHRPDHYKDLLSANPQLKGAFMVDIALNRHGEADDIMYDHNIGYSEFTERN